MRTTEQESLYQNLEKQTVFDLLTQMNQEDFKVPKAVNSSIPQINALVDNILPRIKKGGAPQNPHGSPSLVIKGLLLAQVPSNLPSSFAQILIAIPANPMPKRTIEINAVFMSIILYKNRLKKLKYRLLRIIYLITLTSI